MRKESLIEKAILRYLNKIGFAFKVPDQRRHKESFMVPGISDIIFCCCGKVMFIEVKTEKGKQSSFQKVFEGKIAEHGCEYVVVRSLEDVKWSLERFGIETKENIHDEI